MRISHLTFASLLLVSLPQPSLSQGLLEGANIRALSPGLGAGLGASLSTNKALKHLAGTAQAAAVDQGKLLKQYYQMGCDYEAKQQWAFAEKSFRYALQAIAHKYGPGSIESVPTLEHLSKECKAQKKVDEAISYMKTVLALSQRAKQPDNTILKVQQDLSTLLLDKGDLVGAEPILHDSLGILQRNPALPRQQLKATLQVYGKVLRQLNRGAEAEKIEEAASGSEPQQEHGDITQPAPLSGATGATGAATSATTAASQTEKGTQKPGGLTGSAETPASAVTSTGSVSTPTGPVSTPEGSATAPTAPVSTPEGSATAPTPPVSTPTGSDSTPTGPVSTPEGSATTPTPPVSTPAGSESTPAVPATSPTAPASSPASTVSTPAGSATTPTLPASTPSGSMSTPGGSESAPAVPATSPTAPASSPAGTVSTQTTAPPSNSAATPATQETAPPQPEQKTPAGAN